MNIKTGISLDQYTEASAQIGCEVAAIMAVDEVESQGIGFLADGNVKILFEPHIFWKRLKVHGIDPIPLQAGNESILYPIWDRNKYGPISLQHSKLFRAAAIHNEAAHEACSWGRYQIMGFNYKLCGFSDALSFAASLERDEYTHLLAFVKYIKAAKLDDELRAKMWSAFAEGYNGPAYKKNNYDTRLEVAYRKAVGRLKV